jgi:hypothetical protein
MKKAMRLCYSPIDTGNDNEMPGCSVKIDSGNDSEMPGCSVKIDPGNDSEMPGCSVKINAGNDSEMPGCSVDGFVREEKEWNTYSNDAYEYIWEEKEWNTYSNGAWEFRATYVCIELRLGSYPFQKFRMTPRRFGVKPKNNTNNGVSFEPWVLFWKRKIYFEVKKTEEKVVRIRDVAKYWLKVKGGDRLNFGEKNYNYLNFVQEFHPQ